MEEARYSFLSLPLKQKLKYVKQYCNSNNKSLTLFLSDNQINNLRENITEALNILEDTNDENTIDDNFKAVIYNYFQDVMPGKPTYAMYKEFHNVAKLITLYNIINNNNLTSSEHLHNKHEIKEALNLYKRGILIDLNNENIDIKIEKFEDYYIHLLSNDNRSNHTIDFNTYTGLNQNIVFNEGNGINESFTSVGTFEGGKNKRKKTRLNKKYKPKMKKTKTKMKKKSKVKSNKNGKGYGNNDDDCSICLDKLGTNPYELHCGHRYHPSCIKTLINSNRHLQLKCPMCRNVTRRINVRSKLKKTSANKIRKAWKKYKTKKNNSKTFYNTITDSLLSCYRKYGETCFQMNRSNINRSVNNNRSNLYTLERQRRNFGRIN